MGLITGLVSTIAHAASNKTHEPAAHTHAHGYGYGYGAPAATTSSCCSSASKPCGICAVALPLGAKRQMKRERRAMRHAAKAYRFSGGQYPMAPVVVAAPAGPAAFASSSSSSCCSRRRQPPAVTGLVPAVASVPAPAPATMQPREAYSELEGESSEMPPAYEPGEYRFVERRGSAEMLRQEKQAMS